MKLIKSETGYDADLRENYIAELYEHDGHEIELTETPNGYNIRVDGNSVEAKLNLSKMSLVDFIIRKFIKR